MQIFFSTSYAALFCVDHLFKYSIDESNIIGNLISCKRFMLDDIHKDSL